jgi:uncharacterized protein (TIGR03437 family)
MLSIRFAVLSSFGAIAFASTPAPFAQLPMSIEPNVGQAREGVQFISRGSGYTVQFLPASVLLAVKGKNDALVTMSFPGAGAPKASAVGLLPGTANYFLGKDPASWRRNVPTYSKMRYEGVYPGVDVVFYGSQGRLEYDFVVAPGAAPDRIRVRFEGAGKPTLNRAGDLEFLGASAVFTQHAPVAYQEAAGVRAPVEARYRVLPGGEVALQLGAYDRTRPLVIDPILSYASYLGGNDNDGVLGMKVDSTGAAYLAGFTSSANFRTTAGAAQTRYGGRTPSEQFFGFGDAFVAKLNPAGTALVYCTYLGGVADDMASSIAIDSAGNAYVAGSTNSPGFPVTAGAYQTRFGGTSQNNPFYSRGDAFVVKLGPAGDRILWGTFFGGSSNEMAWAIALDSTGNVTIAGDTVSTDLPTTANAISRTYRGGANIAPNPSGDGFVARLDAAGAALQYASYIGGRSHDMARAVAVDTQGNTYLAGGTFSSDFPTTTGSFQATGRVVETTASYDDSADDGWILKLNPQGAIVYGTYLGGSARDTVFGLAIDAAGSAFVTGRTKSSNFPVTANAVQRTYGGSGARGRPGDSWDGDAFVAKLNPAGAALTYSTYIGGRGDEAGGDIVVDADGNAYVAGYTLSTEFPLSSDALQRTFAGFGGQGLSPGLPPPAGDVNTGDAFVLKLGPTGEILYSSFFGGGADDMGMSVAIDSSRNIYLAGITLSTNLPTAGPIQTAYGGGATLFPRGDAFFAKFADFPRPTPVPARIAFLSPPPSGTAGAPLAVPVTVQVSDAAGTALAGVAVSFAATNATVDTPTSTTDAQGRASTGLRMGTAGTATVTATVSGVTPVTISIAVNAAAIVPAIAAVVNGASFQTALAPGSWMTITGTNFASSQVDATSVPLPTTLGATRVLVNNVAVPLLFAIGTQINVQLPYEIPTGRASVVVQVNGVASAPFGFDVVATAPGIFQYGANRAVAQNIEDSGAVTLNTAANPTAPDRLMLVYFTGQGALDNPVPTGAPAAGALARPTASYSVTVGGKEARVDFVGMTPGAISLGQANIGIPDLEPGDHAVVITIGGRQSNGPLIAVGPRR